MSPIKEKILLLLLGGVAFGYSYTPQKQWKVIKEISKEWKKINKRELHREVRNFYRSKLVERKENKNGSYTIVLTEKGRVKALTYFIQNMKIENKEWDGKWRIVVFDIPEKIRRGRDTLRKKIRELGFHELQKSVFVLPYECKDEIDFIIEFFGLRKYVRYGVLNSIDNNSELKKIFGLK